MGIVYLPWQASYTAHPLINQLSKLIGNTIEDNPFFDHNTSEVTKIMEAFNTFMVRPLLRAGFLADFATDTLVRNYNGDWFSTALKWAFIQKWINIAGYLSEDITDYIQWEWSYTPKNHTADDMALFWENNKWFRQSFADMSFAWKVLNTEMYWKRYWSFFNNLPVIRHFILPSENLGQIIKTMEEDVWYQTLTRWELTEDMISNPEFIKFAFANLTKDFAQFRSEFDESWVRISKYNQDEINLWEQYLKEALQWKTWVDLETYMEWIRSQLWQDAYQKVKLMIHTTPDNSKAYSDFLADYTSDSRLSGVKWLALAAEWMKKELMTSKWLRYKKEGEYSIWEQQAMADIEKQVVERLLPSLYLADRRQRHNVSMFYVIDKYDWTDWKYDIKKHFNLGKDKDWNQLEDYDNVDFLKTVDFKEWRKMDIALWAKMLWLSELSQWNADWFMLNNVITNKLNTYNPMNEKLDERQQLSRFVNTVTYLSEVMEDLNYSEMEIAHGFLPAVTQRLDQYSKLRQDANFIEAVWWVDKIEVYDNVLYKSAKTIKDVSNWLDYLDDINRFNKGYEKSTGKNPWVKWNWWYFSKSPQKDYDKYKMFYPKFLDRSSRNLQSLSKSYGQSNSYSTRTNYSDRERRFLNARPRYSNVISQRAAPDIQQWQWTFTRKTGKSKWIRGSAGGRTGWKMKVPQFVKNKIITRWEGLDRPIPAREIKDSDRRGRQTQS